MGFACEKRGVVPRKTASREPRWDGKSFHWDDVLDVTWLEMMEPSFYTQFLTQFALKQYEKGEE